MMQMILPPPPPPSLPLPPPTFSSSFCPSSSSSFSHLILQIRDLLTRTIEAYVSLYDPANTTRLPVFKLQLCLEETKKEFEFYPSFSDLEAAVLSVVDVVGGAMKKVPDIQVKVDITVASRL